MWERKKSHIKLFPRKTGKFSLNNFPIILMQNNDKVWIIKMMMLIFIRFKKKYYDEIKPRCRVKKIHYPDENSLINILETSTQDTFQVAFPTASAVKWCDEVSTSYASIYLISRELYYDNHPHRGKMKHLISSRALKQHLWILRNMSYFVLPQHNIFESAPFLCVDVCKCTNSKLYYYFSQKIRSRLNSMQSGKHPSIAFCNIFSILS